MKVFSLVDNPAPKKSSRKGANGKARRSKRQKPKIPPRENVSADQIRSRVAAHTKKMKGAQEVHVDRMERFEQEKIPDMEDAEKRIMGDVGLNNPNDLATHGKLKKVLSMGAFEFNEKERAALEKILKE